MDMNVEEIRKWHSIFKPNNELFEIRILGVKGLKGGSTLSAYFYNVEDAIRLIEPYDKAQIYFTVNKVLDACSGRTQFGVFEKVDGSATSKNDIESRQWLPIDIDVDRPSKVSASDEEKEYAHEKAGSVFRFLREAGFPEPVVCDSSSGYHIYYPISIPNTSDSESVVKSFYSVLSNFFTDERVKIDTVVGDANRIMRLYGTWGRKGRNSPERPHRPSKILSSPVISSRMTIDDLSAFVGKYELKIDQNKYRRQYNGSGEEFDLRKFITEHGIEITREQPYGNGGAKFILKECPFDSGHKAPDSALFLSANGAIGFKCLHNSCAGHDWHEFRLHFDPHAYDKKDSFDSGYNRREYQPQQPKTFVPQKETEEKGKKWLSLKDVRLKKMSDAVAIPTGFTYLDKAIKGFLLGEMTILSGINGSGKSSWLDMVMINAIQRGFKVACWSGELTASNLKTWLYLPAAGKNHSIKDDRFDNVYDLDPRYEPILDNWFDGKFFLFNNEYGNKLEQVLSDVTEIVDEQHVSLIVLDNMMALNIDGDKGDRNEKQKDFILKIVELAKKKQVHIIVVMHPRKEVGNTFLRKESISGSGDLSNAAQNIFIIHRVGEDFIKRAGDFFGKQKAETYLQYSNVLECCKNRSFGVVDYLVGMYFEPESKRFKNYQSEYIHYGWEEQPNQQSIPYEQPQEVKPENDMPFAPMEEGEAPF